MAQIGILNALITHLDKTKKKANDEIQNKTKSSAKLVANNLLEPQLTIPLFRHQTNQIRNNQNENQNNGPDSDSSWHSTHYGQHSAPSFNDYGLNSLIDANSSNATINLRPTTDIDTSSDRLLKMIQFKLTLLRNLLPTRPIDYYATTTNDHHLATNWDHLAQLSCDSGEMIVRLNFSEPFKGIVYPDHNRLSPCRFFGDGHHNYELRLPLRGCGTRQAAPRVFINDVVVRFHKSLELEEDEVKTLICRYPAPQPAPMAPFNMNSGTTFDNTQPDQFEFVHSNPDHSNQNDNINNQRKNGLTHIDTISENLAIGTPPPIGPIANSNQDYRQNYNNNKLTQSNDSVSWLEPSWQMIGNQSSSQNNQRNSPLIDSASSPANNPSILNNDNKPALSPSGSGLNKQRLPGGGSSSSPGRFIGPLELLLLISSLMFLVLLALAFTTKYYCFQRRRRRRGPLSSRGALAANMAQATGGHFMPASLSASSLKPAHPRTGMSSAGVATYGPPMKHMQHLHHTQHQLHPHQQAGRAAGRRGPQHNSSFWAPTANNIDELGTTGLRAGRRGQHHIGPSWSSAREHGRSGGDKMQRASGGRAAAAGVALNRRWPNEAQLSDAHLRAVPDGGQLTTTQFRVPPGQHHYHQRADSSTIPYALIEPRHQTLRSSEEAWHNFSSTSPSTDGDNEPEATSGAGSAGQGQQQQRHYAPPHATSGGQSGRQQFDAAAKSQYHLGTLGSNNNQQQRLRTGDERDYMNHDYLHWTEEVESHKETSYYNREQHLHHRVSFAKQKPNQPQSHVYQADHQQHSPPGDSVASGQSALASGDELLLSDGPATSADTALAYPRQMTRAPKPKLIVKSIEDNYIRKFTEIESQEYLSRDSRQALSLAEWQALATSQLNKQANDKENQDIGISDDDDSLQDDSGGASCSNLATNQLRSLSEVDISFARPAAAANLGDNQASNKKATGESANDSKTPESTKLASPASVHDSMTPDLIISPDYAVDDESFNRVRHLELRQPDKTSSGERVDSPSVSYV